VDSSEMSFKAAARLAFHAAIAKAGPVILEPVTRLEVTVPPEAQGDVMGDLNGRRGRVHGTELGEHGEQVIIADVPTAELLRYAVDLRSLSRGRGQFTMTPSHYDVLPSHLLDKVRRETATDDD
jgi:elongation factor G